jgi:hypothetical protein
MPEAPPCKRRIWSGVNVPARVSVTRVGRMAYIAPPILCKQLRLANFEPDNLTRKDKLAAAPDSDPNSDVPVHFALTKD